MPNHCDNEVFIRFPSAGGAKAFCEFMRGEESPFDFNSLIPEPKELLEATDDPVEKARRVEEYGHHGWYEWRLAHWGTKWEAYECDMDDADIEYGELTYRFQTAWGPPEGVHAALITYLETNHPEATVSWFYHEPLMQLTGYLGVLP